jgi:hypothetical protein
MPECGKPRVEGKREQETEDHLDTDRSDSKLLQQLDKIAVVALGLGFSRALDGGHGTGSPRCGNAYHDPCLPNQGTGNRHPSRTVTLDLRANPVGRAWSSDRGR